MPNDRFLSPQDIETALAVFKQRGISGRELSLLLGSGNNQTTRWCRIGAPRHIALAFTALLHDLPPWKPSRARAHVHDGDGSTRRKKK